MAGLALRVNAAARSLSRIMAAPAPFRFASSSAAPAAAAAQDRDSTSNHLNSTVKVEDILAGRGEKVFSTSKDALVFDAVKVMVERNIGCLIVLGDGGEKVEGIMSERDYLEKIIVKGRTSRTTPVRDIMSEKTLVSVTKKSTLSECMVRCEKTSCHLEWEAHILLTRPCRSLFIVIFLFKELMTERRVRHIPVLDGDKAVGMVSIGDVVSALTESYKKREEHMKDFISGGY